MKDKSRKMQLLIPIHCLLKKYILKGASMVHRYQIYSVCALLSMGSLFASDLGLEAEDIKEIAIQNCSKKLPSPKSPQVEELNAISLLYLQPCPDAWRFSADFVYFMPTVDDTYFTINSPIVGDFTLLGTRSNGDFGFNPGVRVGAEYAFCQTRRDIQVFYTYLHATQSGTIFGENLWPTVGSAAFSSPFSDYSGSASSKLKLVYQRLDVNLSQHIIDAHGFNLYVQPGFEYAYLRLQRNYRFELPGFLGTVYQQSRGWGIGPQLGLGFDSNLYQGRLGSKRSIAHAVTVSGLFSSSILTGQGQSREFDVREGDVINDLRDEQTWRVIPVMHARVGLAYLVHGSYVGASLSVGYEFNTYIRGVAKATFPSTASTSNSVTEYYNFDVQGLDISVAFTF
jgi:hypothetical protein